MSERREMWVFVTHKRSRNLFGLQVEIVGKEEWSHDLSKSFLS